MLGLGVIGAVVLGALGASSASALPEWGQCVVQPAHEGKYTDSNCTKKAKTILKEGKKVPTGEFEWRKNTELSSAQRKFEGANVGSGGVLYTHLRACDSPPAKSFAEPRKKCTEEGSEESKAGNVSVECKAERNTGETSGTKNVANIVVIFTGCDLFGSIPCANTASEGEIVVNKLKGSLGYINKSKKEVGIVLEPTVKKGEFARFNCGGTLETIVGVGNSTEGAFWEPETTGGYDGIISPITPVDQMTTSFEQVYKAEHTGENDPEPVKNIPSKFEGKHIELLEDWVFVPSEPSNRTGWSSAAEEITNVNHPAEAGEIKA